MSLRRWMNQRAVESVINYKNEPLGFLVNRFAHDEVFSFTRFGDGEWSAMLNRQGENCDGHAYSEELGKQLKNAFNQPPANCVFGMQLLAMRLMGKELKTYIQKESIHVDWINADIFHDANKRGELYPLVEQLRCRPVVLIGPEFLSGIADVVFPLEHRISIPEKNCF